MRAKIVTAPKAAYKAELSAAVGGKAQKVAASIHIHEADRMTPEGRKRIATWLRRQANWLIKHGDNYAPRFTARYNVPARD